MEDRGSSLGALRSALLYLRPFIFDPLSSIFDPRLLLRRARFHLVALRLLRRRDDLRGAALGGDLLGSRLREVVRLDDQFLRHVAGAEDAHAVSWALRQAGFLQRLAVHRVAVLERLIDIADVDN